MTDYTDEVLVRGLRHYADGFAHTAADYMRAAADRIAALPRQTVQDGWVCVPKAPTREMILAAWSAKEESGRAGFGKASWEAMLTAAPPQQDKP